MVSNVGSKIKQLHLGCGSVHIEGWVNVDINYQPGVDVMDNVIYLRKFKPNSVDLIYACNVLEHLGRWNYPIALKRWYDLLKPGGTLRLSVPDFEAICRYYLQTGDIDSIYCALHGGQDNPQNVHYWSWDFDTLANELSQIGFINIRRYDRNATEHSHVRDWSLNYVPYHDKDGNELPDAEWFKGTSIALNIEATKESRINSVREWGKLC